MIQTADVQVGDYFLLDNDTIVVIRELLSTDYYKCSDNEIHSIYELLPLGSEYLDLTVHQQYFGEALNISKSEPDENDNTILLAKPSHIVQNYMRETHNVEYSLYDDVVDDSKYTLVI